MTKSKGPVYTPVLPVFVINGGKSTVEPLNLVLVRIVQRLYRIIELSD